MLAESLWIGVRAGLYGCAPLIVAMLFGLDPAWGMLLVPFIGVLVADQLAAGILIAALVEKFENTSYVQSLLITPLFLLGTFFPISAATRTGRSPRRSSTRSTTASSSCWRVRLRGRGHRPRHRAGDLRGPDVAAATWRMRKRLIS